MVWGRARASPPRAEAGAAAGGGLPAIPSPKGRAHVIGRWPDRRAALPPPYGLSPIGFLDVHGEIDRAWGGLTPL